MIASSYWNAEDTALSLQLIRVWTLATWEQLRLSPVLLRCTTTTTETC